jgi:hypothetical protein
VPLTAAELEVVSLLAQADAAFRALPERMTSDDEFGVFVHALQHRVMARAALREHADTFAPLSGVLPETPPLGYAGDGMPPGWRAVNDERPPADGFERAAVLDDLGTVEVDGSEPPDGDVPVTHGPLTVD